MESQAYFLVIVSRLLVGRPDQVLWAAVCSFFMAEVWSWIEILAEIALYFCSHPYLITSDIEQVMRPSSMLGAAALTMLLAACGASKNGDPNATSSAQLVLNTIPD